MLVEQQYQVFNSLDGLKVPLLVYINHLRILDIHGAKTHENQTPLARLPQ